MIKTKTSNISEISETHSLRIVCNRHRSRKKCSECYAQQNMSKKEGETRILGLNELTKTNKLIT